MWNLFRQATEICTEPVCCLKARDPTQDMRRYWMVDASDYSFDQKIDKIKDSATSSFPLAI